MSISDARLKEINIGQKLITYSEVVNKLGYTELSGGIKRRADNLVNSKYRILVIGEFKRGKSTLLNALLGTDILPAKMAPCTAIPTVITYAKEPRAIVKFNNKFVEYSLDEFKNKYQLQASEDFSNSALQKDRFDKISSATICYPLDILKNGVDIIDSPGLAESPIRTARTIKALQQVDAVLFVLDATQLLTTDELSFIDNRLIKQGIRNLFFVINKWNKVKEDGLSKQSIQKDYNDLNERIDSYLTPRLGGLETNRIFRVNALGSLKNKLNNNDDLHENGIIDLESSLTDYIINEKHLSRISQVGVEIQRFDTDINKFIFARLDNLNEEPEILKEKVVKYEAQSERLNEILSNLENFSKARLLEEQNNWNDELMSIVDSKIKDMKDLRNKFDRGLFDYIKKYNFDPAADHGDDKLIELRKALPKSLLFEMTKDSFWGMLELFSKEKNHIGIKHKINEASTPFLNENVEKLISEWTDTIESQYLLSLQNDIYTYLTGAAKKIADIRNELDNINGIEGNNNTEEVYSRWSELLPDEMKKISGNPVNKHTALESTFLIGIGADIAVSTLAEAALFPYGTLMGAAKFFIGNVQMKDKFTISFIDALIKYLEEMKVRTSKDIQRNIQSQINSISVGIRETIIGDIDNIKEMTLEIEQKINQKESAVDKIRSDIEENKKMLQSISMEISESCSVA